MYSNLLTPQNFNAEVLTQLYNEKKKNAGKPFFLVIRVTLNFLCYFLSNMCSQQAANTFLSQMFCCVNFRHEIQNCVL